MEKNYFQQALSDFTFDMASGGAIRHLTDLGYTVKQIQEHLSFPTPYERVQREVWSHLIDTGVILLDEPGRVQREKISYVRDYDQYGKASFRRIVEKDETAAVLCWKEEHIKFSEIEKLRKLLQEGTADDGKSAFLSCDFGLIKYREPERFQEILSTLPDKNKEYLEGIPWEKKTVYHRIDGRMRDILLTLFESEMYTGSCYFLDIQTKVII